MNTAQSWQPFGTNEQKAFGPSYTTKSAEEEIQGIGHGLNPDAPEFAPTFDTESTLGLPLPQQGIQQRNGGSAGSLAEQSMGWRGGPEQNRGRQVTVLVNHTTVMI